jgi:hypothetical protein
MTPEEFLAWLDERDDDDIIEVDVEYDDLEGYDDIYGGR